MICIALLRSNNSQHSSESDFNIIICCFETQQITRADHAMKPNDLCTEALVCSHQNTKNNRCEVPNMLNTELVNKKTARLYPGFRDKLHTEQRWLGRNKCPSLCKLPCMCTYGFKTVVVAVYPIETNLSPLEQYFVASWVEMKFFDELLNYEINQAVGKVSAPHVGMTSSS